MTPAQSRPLSEQLALDCVTEVVLNDPDRFWDAADGYCVVRHRHGPDAPETGWARGVMLGLSARLAARVRAWGGLASLSGPQSTVALLWKRPAEESPYLAVLRAADHLGRTGESEPLLEAVYAFHLTHRAEFPHLYR